MTICESILHFNQCEAFKLVAGDEEDRRGITGITDSEMGVADIVDGAADAV